MKTLAITIKIAKKHNKRYAQSKKGASHMIDKNTYTTNLFLPLARMYLIAFENTLCRPVSNNAII
jgi:hypothetical protein